MVAWPALKNILENFSFKNPPTSSFTEIAIVNRNVYTNAPIAYPTIKNDKHFTARKNRFASKPYMAIFAMPELLSLSNRALLLTCIDF